MNDQKGWKRLHDTLAAESACLSSAEWQRRYYQVTALGNCTVTVVLLRRPKQEHLEVQVVASPELGVDDDLYEDSLKIHVSLRLIHG